MVSPLQTRLTPLRGHLRLRRHIASERLRRWQHVRTFWRRALDPSNGRFRLPATIACMRHGVSHQLRGDLLPRVARHSIYDYGVLFASDVNYTQVHSLTRCRSPLRAYASSLFYR